MWIMLTKKLPLKPSPPKLSIFWSEPWINEEYAARQFDRIFDLVDDLGIEVNGSRRNPVYTRTNEKNERVVISKESSNQLKVLFMSHQDPILYMEMGKENNWALARSIMYKGEKIRVFANEFTVMRKV